jgi:bifunctional non-homologous end joining protein LigD
MLSRSAPPARPAGFIKPCLPTLAPEVPGGPLWVHEIKHDGYRFICRREGESVRIFSRHGLDWTERVPLIAEALLALPVSSVTLDGEGVVCDAKGLTDFDRLRSALARRGSREAFLYAFDLLERDGQDLRARQWHERRATLEGLLPRARAQSGCRSTSTAPTAQPSSGMPAQWAWKASSRSAVTAPTGRAGEVVER